MTYALIISVALAVLGQANRLGSSPNYIAKFVYELFRDWAGAIGALLTLMIVTVAFLAIMDNRYARQVDRKERLLKEIIEWAIDISRWRPKEIHRDLAGIRDKVKRQELIDAHIATIMDSLIEMRGRNQYTLRIALKVVEQMGKAATHSLIKDVHGLIGEAEQYIDILVEWKAIITDAMAKDTVADDGEYFEKAEHSEYELEKRVKKVIDEATNLY